MNIEKATYLNTLQAAESGEGSRRIAASYAAGRIGGGIRFTVKARSKVRCVADYRTLSERATLSLDGKPVALTLRPHTEVELRLDKGEHIFETVSPSSHGGLTLYVEGFGVARSCPYFDRVGGYLSPSECVVYLKRGRGVVEKCVYNGSTVVCTPRTERYYDEAYRYDPVSGYTATKRSCYAGAQNFTINSGVTTTYAYADLLGLAMCDNRTLPSGTDYLVAFADKYGALRFIRMADQTVLTASDLSAKVADVRRVVSAARGSIFLAEGTDRRWAAYHFHPQGALTLTIGEYALPYDTIEVGRTGGYAPTATIDADGAPILYYRLEDGRLIYGAEGGTTHVAYAEAYHPAASGGLLQVEGELTPYQL